MRKVCPECKGNLFKHDKVHDETVCRQCGLILLAPPSHGLVFPGYYVIPSKKKIQIKSSLTGMCYDVYYHL